MRGLILLVGLVIAGCASKPVPPAQQKAIALRLGDPAAPPSLSALPELERWRSEQLHRGLAQAGQTLAAQPPAAPASHVYLELSAWLEEDVARWVEARREAVEETRFQFVSSADSDAAAHTIASAVVGLLHEDTARALGRIPQPVELDTEPEIAALFRELVDTQAAPFIHAARDEYLRCADRAAEQDRTLDRFARFCRSRAERLAPQASPAERVAAR